MDEARTALHLAVKEAYDAGLCVIPPREDGSKAPEGYWGEFIEQRADIEILRDAYRTERHGIGLVTGRVSKNLECCEFESETAYLSFKVAAALAGLDDVVERVEAGYLERAPRGGYHWLWYCEFSGSGRKLAMVATGDPAAPYETAIETRFEGQFIIVAPSHGPIHPTGRPYVRVNGGFATIYSIRDEDRQALFRVAENLDQCPRSDDGFAMFAPTPGDEGDGDRPGDDFIRRGRWHEDVLLPAGWTLVGSGIDREGRPQEFWRRPGKDQGNSATLHPMSGPGGHGLFVPYSTSTPFPVCQRGYNKFRAFAFLLHDGDFKAATTAVKAAGFKTRVTEPPKLTLVPPLEDGDEFGGMWGHQVFELEVPEVEHLLLLGQDGFIMKGAANLLYAFPKAGKTELIAALLREWTRAGEPAVYLSEEPLFFWKERLEAMPEPPAFWSRTMFYPALGWGLDKAFRALARHQGGILVVDTLRNTLGYSEAKGDEDVSRVIVPVIAAARELGMTLVALYHARKMPGENGTDISGHHSLYGAFDRAIQLRPIDGEENARKRRLVVSGRLLDPMAPTKMTYIMRDDGTFEALDAAAIVRYSKTCEGCGQEFQGRRSTARFHDDACRKQSFRKGQM